MADLDCYPVQLRTEDTRTDKVSDWKDCVCLYIPEGEGEWLGVVLCLIISCSFYCQLRPMWG